LPKEENDKNENLLTTIVEEFLKKHIGGDYSEELETCVNNAWRFHALHINMFGNFNIGGPVNDSVLVCKEIKVSWPVRWDSMTTDPWQ